MVWSEETANVSMVAWHLGRFNALVYSKCPQFWGRVSLALLASGKG